jgi:flagellar hook-length control protein FliK
VHLQEAVDAVRATFTAANQAGISSARISLSPESLGGIKISLSQTPDGLIARVATDHPETAQTLQQNIGDLRRSLEAGGMSLLRLDIGSSGQQSLAGFTGSDHNGSPANGNGDRTSASGDTADGDEITPPTELTIQLTSGSLVNVLA